MITPSISPRRQRRVAEAGSPTGVTGRGPEVRAPRVGLGASDPRELRVEGVDACAKNAATATLTTKMTIATSITLRKNASRRSNRSGFLKPGVGGLMTPHQFGPARTTPYTAPTEAACSISMPARQPLQITKDAYRTGVNTPNPSVKPPRRKPIALWLNQRRGTYQDRPYMETGCPNTAATTNTAAMQAVTGRAWGRIPSASAVALTATA